MASDHGVHGRVATERDSAIDGLNLQDRYESKNKIVENDAQVYARDTAKPQVEQAENRLRAWVTGHIHTARLVMALFPLCGTKSRQAGTTVRLITRKVWATT